MNGAFSNSAAASHNNFLKIKIHAILPAAMPAPATSRRKTQLAASRARCLARAERREEMLEDVAGGVEFSVIARQYGVSVKTVRREIGRALDERWTETPQRHLRLQNERLSRAVRALEDALLNGDIAAVDPLLRVLDRLDRYNALGQPAAPPDPPEPRLALTHQGQDLAPSALKTLEPDLSLNGDKAP